MIHIKSYVRYIKITLLPYVNTQLTININPTLSPTITTLLLTQLLLIHIFTSLFLTIFSCISLYTHINDFLYI